MTINADNFSGPNDAATVQAAIDYAFANNSFKTVLLSDRDYYITGKIIIKQGVKLLFGYGTRFVVNGNFRVLELQRNASLDGAYIAIDDVNFNSPVIYLDGKYKYYNTWNKTVIKDINIVNWSGSYRGTGLHLYSYGTGHEISFVNFENINFAGLNTAIRLQSVKPSTGYSWVNANRFNKVSVDDCVQGIVFTSSESIPNECSGNLFTNLQIQPSAKTVKLITISGQYNEFDGMAWDLGQVRNNTLVEFTSQSSYNKIDIRSIPAARIVDNGRFNVK
ncbi:hypothetical protein [Fictibacillus barbaricus]|uniref:Pectate lyase superfamily protein domain-containing protein n=1 Tax=Fictibacillus barbaricus TaxID=182136 RepID=A0ABS2ZEY3_9BACL|nr:hypothetical protein [Fictibacillus barbaricus]MBN3546495.1 hypothetical protein [Fictibacillus barbaricus]GGB41483.1 hypothetical protein GCM10007199_03430 [Fictibacillus barbaricus]